VANDSSGPHDTEPAAAVLSTAGGPRPSAPPKGGADGLTVPGHGEAGAPPAMPGTIQLRADTVPVMATLTGEPIPSVLPPSMPPARYEVGREIARGGMGRVVEAMDTTLGRVVALKEALSTEADALRRFQREIKITARLEHPSIVPVHDAGNTETGAPFYVMRKVSGRPLEELVAASAALGPRLALIPHLVASAQAIAHAHGRGIVHRDIKPSNILVGDLGETIVIDWGLAKAIDEPDESDAGSSIQIDVADLLKTRVGVVFGTPGFMAPEQLQGAAADERCDVYALGATLYHLLARKPPHHAKTADLMMRAAVDGPPTPVSAIVDGVPPELSTIVDKALALDPEQRYQTAKELAEDLQRFLTGKLVASHHYSTLERLTRFVRRNRVPVLAVVLATLALIVGGAVAVSRVVDERDRADDSARVARAEKLEAEARADQLTLTQARYNVETNPTLAVAMIKPLAQKYWREVRGIGAAARAGGVAYSLPASANTLALRLSHDGRHAIASGEDGVVRVYDVVARTARVVAELHAPVRVRYADGEHRIVAFHANQITILDATTGARRDLAVASPILDLEVIATTAYFADGNGAAWQLDLAGSTPVAVTVDDKIKEVSPSPDGRWLALTGATHLYLLDRNRPATDPLMEVMIGVAKDIGWAADSSHLAALVNESMIDLEMGTVPTPTMVHKLNVGQRYAVAYGADQLYTVGPVGVSIISSTESVTRRPLAGTPLGIHESRGGTMVIGAQGSLAVLSDDGDRQLGSPVDELVTVEASPRSPYVVAAVADKLLVWNLDEIQPRRVVPKAVAAAGFVGGDQVIASISPAARRSWACCRPRVRSRPHPSRIRRSPRCSTSRTTRTSCRRPTRRWTSRATSISRASSPAIRSCSRRAPARSGSTTPSSTRTCRCTQPAPRSSASAGAACIRAARSPRRSTTAPCGATTSPPVARRPCRPERVAARSSRQRGTCTTRRATRCTRGSPAASAT